MTIEGHHLTLLIERSKTANYGPWADQKEVPLNRLTQEIRTKRVNLKYYTYCNAFVALSLTRANMPEEMIVLVHCALF